MQHAVTCCLTLFALWVREWYPRSEHRLVEKKEERDGRRDNFSYVHRCEDHDPIPNHLRPILISLTLLYTSLLPLLLQLGLGIWYTPPQPYSSTQPIPHISLEHHLPLSVISHISPKVLITFNDAFADFHHTYRCTDKIWAGTRLLGGMSSGFGLRVLLPTKPWETVGIVLLGWAASGLVGRSLGSS